MKWLLITTIGKNPGDEWIRIGIQNMIREVDPGGECILLDKEDPSVYKTPVEFDKCIWCGMPVFWSLGEEQNRKIFWWQDLMLGWPSERKNDFMVLGAGSFFPWGKELETITYKEQLVKSAEDVLSRSYFVTARDEIVSKVTGKSIPHMICPAVFSIIDYKKSHELKLANIMPQGSHYAVFGPQEAEIWDKKKYEISKILQQNGFTYVAHNQKEIQFAQNCGWEKIIAYNGNPNGLLAYYGRCGKYFGNRIHGAIVARGNDADVWSAGYDSRQEAVKLSGARVSKPSELDINEIEDWASWDIETEPFDMKSNFEKHVDIVRRFTLAGNRPLSDNLDINHGPDLREGFVNTIQKPNSTTIDIPSSAFNISSNLFNSLCNDISTKQRVLNIISRLTRDHWLDRNIEMFKEAVEHKSQWFETLSFLNWYADTFKPGYYLEIGVRRGRSMAQVLAQSPQTRAYGFDSWIKDYSGTPNPGPDFVISELKNLSVNNLPILIKGNSHVTLPGFWADPNSPQQFELILVDGDHSYEGAKKDLKICLEHLAPGGALVFDDITHHSHPELKHLWQEYKARFTDYIFIEHSHGHGTGIAFKPPFKKLEQYLRRPYMGQQPAHTLKRQRNVLFIRTDSIGDNILAAPMLPHIRQKYRDAKITIICQEHIAELYEACPYVDDIVVFSRKRILEDECYRKEIVRRLQALKPELSLNSVFSREPLTDLLAIECGARERIAFEGDLSNISAELRHKHNQFYTKLLPSEGKHKPELARHGDFLRSLGINVPLLKPVVWTTDEDEKFAEKFFEWNNLRSEHTIALFPGAQHSHKAYQSYKCVLQNFEGFNFLILGGRDAKAQAGEICENFPDRCYDLTDKTTIRQMASIMRKCRLYLGSDSAGAHIACAIGIPNVVVLGGGHFGRFMPYSPLTSIACLPLDCYGCNWKCRYERAHCVDDVAPEVITEAVRQTLERTSEKPRVFVQGDSLWKPKRHQPAWSSFDSFLDAGTVEIVPIGKIPAETYENWQGRLYWQKGELSNALKHFTKALKIAPYDRTTVLNCGQILASHDKIEDAGKLYHSYLQRYPNDKEIADASTKLQKDRAVKTNDGKYLMSAIVSTYNSERFLRGCLEDLENQTIADKLEIIIVNSGSEQNEEKIVKEYQQKYNNIIYIKTDQREGIYTAWNRAVKAARGKFITNANTDDRHSKDALEIMANTLLANPDIALVYGDQIRTDTPNETFDNHHGAEMQRRPDYSRERLLFGCCTGSQPMWRKSLHDEFGYFDETLTCAADWDFWLRISKNYKFKHIPEFLGLYYHNETGIEHGRKIHSLYERYIVGKQYGTPYISVIPLYESKDNPLVSVIMPAYNADEHIAGTIESVLIQNYRNFELIVVDDGSTDNTKDIITSFKNDKIKYFYKENAGAASARNLGIKKSKGAFLINLDTDDMMTPDFITKHLQEFEKYPEADLVYCDDCLIDKNDKPIRVIERPEYTDRKSLIRDLFRCGFPIVPFRTCIRRSVFDEIGLFDEQLVVAEDYDMMRRFVKKGLKIHHLKGALYLRRMTAESLSRNFTAQKAKSHFEVVKWFIDTFTCDELFPDVAWDKISPETRQLDAKCLAAMTCLTIGQTYVKTNVPVYAKAAFELACSQLNDCLKTDPENQRVQQLLQKCEIARDRCAETAKETICQTV